MKKIFLYALRYTLIAVLLTGCATTSNLSSLHPSLSAHSFNIKGTEYVPLTAVSDSYKIGCKWDSVSRKAILEKPGTKIVFALDSNLALVNEKAKKMQQSAVIHKGALSVPLEFIKTCLVLQPAEKKRRVKKTIFAPSTSVSKKKRSWKTSSKYRISKIVIDPGHGGKDPGAVGRYGLMEKDVVLDISKRLKRKLEARGIKVLLTRNTDRFISLGRRPAIANKNEADFFISIHANASRYRKAKGFEVYYLSDAVDDSARALAAAENASLKFEDKSFDNTNNSRNLDATLWDIIYTENRAESIELAKYLCKEAKRKLWVRDRGVKGARFFVLKGARMPAVLVEVGFISNTKEESKLKDPKYRQRIAESLKRGILAYKKEYEATDGFTR